jgi:hypothetical protein
MARRYRKKLPDGMEFCPSCQMVLPLTERHWTLNTDEDYLGMWDPYCAVCMCKRTPKKSTSDGPVRVCEWCQDEKALMPRYWHRDRKKPGGFDQVCKLCRLDRARQRRQRRRIKLNSRFGSLGLAKSKECNTCGKVKALKMFSRDNGCPDGRARRCKSCSSKWYAYQRRRKLAQKGDD